MSGDELDEADEMELSGADFVESAGPRLDRRRHHPAGPERRTGRPALPPFLPVWMYILPPLPDDQWTAIRDHVAAELAAAGR